MTSNLPNFYKSPHVLAGCLPDTPVLVGLSGGADSSCLLHLLARERKKHYFPLYAAHVNHGIRTEEYGYEADRDESFCRELCQSLGVELFVTRIDVPAISQNEGGSLETVARDARYTFFSEIMRKKSIRILATAHNADDNLETQIFNLCRGCGLSGICGIPETREFSEADGIIVRPILSGTKKEILEYCISQSISYVTDSTNLENDCTRNRIRNIVIPELNSLFTAPQRSAMRLSKAAKEDLDFIHTEAERFLRSNPTIQTEKLLSLHPSVAKRVLTIAYGEKSDATLEETHLTSITKLARSKKNGSISLPCDICAIFEDGILRFDSRKPDIGNFDYLVRLSHGVNLIEGTPFAIIITESDNSVKVSESEWKLFAKTELFAADTDLSARNRREGDAILLNGMHKKVKKLLCDFKIPLSVRNLLPLICTEDDIAYIPGCARSDVFSKKSVEKPLSISVYLKR